jgi:mannosyl-3-phosphoglycerate phosphatase
VRRFMNKVGDRLGIKGFGDWTPEEIAKRSGLPLPQAALAKEREFTEPFLLERQESLGCLCALAAEKGLKVTQGGRFHHLIGRDQDKGKAVEIVTGMFQSHSQEPLTTIGIGDSENDLPMFEKVDIPVLIPRPGKGHLDIRLPGLIRASKGGAKGWNEVVQRLLNEQGEAFMNGS